MSIETLNSAARAAGFAMAASEGPEDETGSETPESTEWRSEAMMLHQAEPAARETPAKVSFSLGEWVKGVFTFRRGAPA